MRLEDSLSLEDLRDSGREVVGALVVLAATTAVVDLSGNEVLLLAGVLGTLVSIGVVELGVCVDSRDGPLEPKPVVLFEG